MRQSYSMTRTRFMTGTAVLAALATIIMFLEIQIPVFPQFLKIDLSDTMALLAAFSMGPISGVLVELIKNLVHLTMTMTAGVGELANFLIGAALVLPAGIVYMYMRKFQGAIIGLISGVISMCVLGVLVNYYILIPFYIKAFSFDAVMKMAQDAIPAIDSTFTLVLYAILPFNLLKGVVVSLITLPLYKRVSGVLKTIGGRTAGDTGF